MNVMVVRLYAVLVLALSIVGFFVSGHLFKIMNVDPALDLFRLALAVVLIRIGFSLEARDGREANFGLILVGVAYLGLAIGGLIDSKLGNLLPSGLTGFDIVFHIVTGLAALGVALMPVRRSTAG
jgi:hypothetical protein